MTEFDATEVKSKSQLKREHHALQTLARRLVDLPNRTLEALGLSPELLDAVQAARRMQRGTLRRQIRFVTGLLARDDPAALEGALDRLQAPHRASVNTLHEVEAWRDRLLQGGDEALALLAEELPELDCQQIRQLVRNARREAEQGRPPAAARTLFRTLSALRAARDGGGSTG